MARDDDREPVVSVRAPDGSLRAGETNVPGEITVAPGSAVGDLEESLPYSTLERRTAEHDRGLEDAKLTAEIALELVGNLPEVSIFAGHHRAVEEPPEPNDLCRQHAAVDELEEAQ